LPPQLTVAAATPNLVVAIPAAVNRMIARAKRKAMGKKLQDKCPEFFVPRSAHEGDIRLAVGCFLLRNIIVAATLRAHCDSAIFILGRKQQ
jgi:hypothetical protein